MTARVVILTIVNYSGVMMDIFSSGKRKGSSAKGHVNGTCKSTAIQM
jgi:hypothetical protein